MQKPPLLRGTRGLLTAQRRHCHCQRGTRGKKFAYLKDRGGSAAMQLTAQRCHCQRGTNGKKVCLAEEQDGRSILIFMV